MGGLRSLLPSTYLPHTPCSLLIFCLSFVFSNFHWSFLISLFSLLPFEFPSWWIHLLLASFYNYPLLLNCSLLRFLYSLLPDYQFHAPCSRHYFRPCSLLPWVLKGILPTSWLPLMGVGVGVGLPELGISWFRFDLNWRSWKWRDGENRNTQLNICIIEGRRIWVQGKWHCPSYLHVKKDKINILRQRQRNNSLILSLIKNLGELKQKWNSQFIPCMILCFCQYWILRPPYRVNQAYQLPWM